MTTEQGVIKVNKDGVEIGCLRNPNDEIILDSVGRWSCEIEIVVDQLSEDVIKVTTEYDQEFRDHGVCVVYKNGVEIGCRRNFNDAMILAFHDWIPQGNGHEAMLDNNF